MPKGAEARARFSINMEHRVVSKWPHPTRVSHIPRYAVDRDTRQKSPLPVGLAIVTGA